MKKSVAGGVFLLVAFIGCVWWLLARENAEKISLANTSSSVATSDLGRSNRSAVESKGFGATSTTPKSLRPSSADRTPLYDAFVKSTDFPQTLRSLMAQKSNPEAKYLATLLFWRCANFWGPQLTAFHRKKIDVESNGNLAGTRVSRIKALDAEILRCQNMTPEDFNTPSPPYELVKQAAAAGDPKALAAQLVRDNTKSREEDLNAAKSAQQLAALRDPLVIANLAGYFDTRDSSHRWRLEPFEEPISGKDLAIAWSLSACEFGADCSNQSVQLVTGCIRLGNCDVEDLNAYFQRYITSPEQFARIMQLKGMILTGLTSGQWPAGMWQGGEVKKR